MALSKDQIVDLHKKLMKRDHGRNNKFRAMDVMYYNNPAVPEGFSGPGMNWFRWVPTTMPSDGVLGSDRTLSRHEPIVHFAPHSFNQDDAKTADQIERVLLSQFMGTKRKQRQIIHSAINHDMTAVQLDFLSWNKKNLKKGGMNPKLLDAALRKSQFDIKVRNAKNVHAVRGVADTLAQVVYERLTPVEELVAEWGQKKVDNLLKFSVNFQDNEPLYAYVVETYDHDIRAVHAYLTDNLNIDAWEQMADGGNLAWFLEPDSEDANHGLDFIPWVVKGGGNNTETNEELHFRPMNDSVFKSGQYDTYNLVRSLLVSAVFVTFGLTQTVTETEDGRYPREVRDGGSPEGTFTLEIGEKVYRLPTIPFDTGLLELARMFEKDISASTISRVLMGDFPEGAAFASIDIGNKNATKAIVPFQNLAEDTIAELMEMMLYYSAHAEIDLEAWVQKSNVDEEAINTEERIEWNTIDAERVQIKIELTPDIPLDNVSRINGGLMLLQAGASRKYVLTYAGIKDATKVMQERVQEDLDAIEMQNAGQILSKEVGDAMQEMAVQLVKQQMEQEAEQEQAQAKAAEGGDGEEPLTQAGNLQRGEGPNVKGEGANPNVAGENTQADPVGRTREKQNSTE